jgi:hypothetical protein
MHRFRRSQAHSTLSGHSRHLWLCVPVARVLVRGLVLAIACLSLTLAASPALASSSDSPRESSTSTWRAPSLAAVASEGSGSLESAASKAGETGRKIAMSMIALGFSIASIVLAFRRDFKEAASVFAIGLVAILLATPAGENVLHATVNSLFGAS